VGGVPRCALAPCPGFHSMRATVASVRAPANVAARRDGVAVAGDVAWRLFPGENHVRYSGAATMASVRHVLAGGVATRRPFMLPLLAQPGDPSSRIGVFLGTAAVLHVRLSAVLGLGLDSR